MKNLLSWMGEHPVLVIFLILIVGIFTEDIVTAILQHSCK